MKFIPKLTVFFIFFVSLFPLSLPAMDVAMTLERAYSILQVAENATREEVERAYKTLALQWHPDRNRGNEEAATKEFQQINAAKEHLLNRGTAFDPKKAIEKTTQVIIEKNEQVTFYDLIGVSADASSDEIEDALGRFGQIWEDFYEVIECMIPNYVDGIAFTALQSTLTQNRAMYNSYLALPYEEKLTHEKFRPFQESCLSGESDKSCTINYQLKQEVKAIAKESLIGLAGGVAAGAAYLGLAALTRNQDCIKALPAVVGFYGYTALAAVLGAGIGVNLRSVKSSWTAALGIGARALLFGAVTKFSATYVEAGLKWASRGLL